MRPDSHPVPYSHLVACEVCCNNDAVHDGQVRKCQNHCILETVSQSNDSIGHLPPFFLCSGHLCFDIWIFIFDVLFCND